MFVFVLFSFRLRRFGLRLLCIYCRFRGRLRGRRGRFRSRFRRLRFRLLIHGFVFVF